MTSPSDSTIDHQVFHTFIVLALMLWFVSPNIALSANHRCKNLFIKTIQNIIDKKYKFTVEDYYLSNLSQKFSKANAKNITNIKKNCNSVKPSKIDALFKELNHYIIHNSILYNLTKKIKNNPSFIHQLKYPEATQLIPEIISRIKKYMSNALGQEAAKQVNTILENQYNETGLNLLTATKNNIDKLNEKDASETNQQISARYPQCFDLLKDLTDSEYLYHILLESCIIGQLHKILSQDSFEKQYINDNHSSLSVYLFKFKNKIDLNDPIKRLTNPTSYCIIERDSSPKLQTNKKSPLINRVIKNGNEIERNYLTCFTDYLHASVIKEKKLKKTCSLIKHAIQNRKKYYQKCKKYRTSEPYIREVTKMNFCFYKLVDKEIVEVAKKAINFKTNRNEWTYQKPNTKILQDLNYFKEKSMKEIRELKIDSNSINCELYYVNKKWIFNLKEEYEIDNQPTKWVKKYKDHKRLRLHIRQIFQGQWTHVLFNKFLDSKLLKESETCNRYIFSSHKNPSLGRLCFEDHLKIN